MCPHRLAVRTPPFHGGNRGSSPRGDAIFYTSILQKLYSEARAESYNLFCSGPHRLVA